MATLYRNVRAFEDDPEEPWKTTGANTETPSPFVSAPEGPSAGQKFAGLFGPVSDLQPGQFFAKAGGNEVSGRLTGAPSDRYTGGLFAPATPPPATAPVEVAAPAERPELTATQSLLQELYANKSPAQIQRINSAVTGGGRTGSPEERDMYNLYQQARQTDAERKRMTELYKARTAPAEIAAQGRRDVAGINAGARLGAAQLRADVQREVSRGNIAGARDRVLLQIGAKKDELTTEGEQEMNQLIQKGKTAEAEIAGRLGVAKENKGGAMDRLKLELQNKLDIQENAQDSDVYKTTVKQLMYLQELQARDEPNRKAGYDKPIKQAAADVAGVAAAAGGEDQPVEVSKADYEEAEKIASFATLAELNKKYPNSKVTPHLFEESKAIVKAPKKQATNMYRGGIIIK